MTFYIGQKKAGEIYLGSKKIGRLYLGQTLIHMTKVVSKPTFLEYVETDGASYIDTGYCPNENTYVEYTFEVTQNPTASYNGLFGSRVNTSIEEYHIFLTSGLTLRLDFGRYAEPNVNYKTELNTKYTIKAGSGEIYINDELVKSYTPKTGQTKNSMYLGNFNNNGTPYTTGVAQKIYGWKVYENSVLLHDFVPCIAPNGKVAMYDTVTKQYFYNQGTGELKAGGRFVESIVFDGASYINTGIIYQTCDVECRIKFYETGTRQLMGFSGASSIHYWGFSTSGVFEPLTSVSASGFTDVRIEYNKDNPDAKTLTMIVGDKTATKTGKIDTSKSYLIGCLDTSSYFMQGEIQSNKIYIGGELVQDLRPYVDANGVACFKDVVTDTLFYNQGTGTLTYTE